LQGEPDVMSYILQGNRGF